MFNLRINMSLVELDSMSLVVRVEVARGMIDGLREVWPVRRERFDGVSDDLRTLRAKQYELTHRSRLSRPGGIGQFVPRDHHSSRHIGR